ncbi:hypothetical protein H696_05065 [Fonticula alba]|uniref:TNFR-Cys domain-containing protein n=1 Tax=Fonticula alba TaxID=691883 RepID=A0A058Z393_FONAL|nr:hypothetical protein H696_05065 [Fonticula alba]KCV68769.1 hypothetical protein H696_05065 [Fonticula alba]|eukprot:XP_009497201.1 hypothetical protein H696_05065 [Fonticula alba]
MRCFTAPPRRALVLALFLALAMLGSSLALPAPADQPACGAGQYASPGSPPVCAPCHASCRSCFDREDFCTSCPMDGAWLLPGTGVCVSACPAGQFIGVAFPGAVAPAPGQVCLTCPDGCEACSSPGDAPACVLTPDGSLDCPAVARCDRCAEGLLLLDGTTCVASCPESGYLTDSEGKFARVPACVACAPQCTACNGPGAEQCTAGPEARRNHALVIGLSVIIGLVVLAILIIGLTLAILRRANRLRRKDRPAPSPPSSPSMTTDTGRSRRAGPSESSIPMDTLRR